MTATVTATADMSAFDRMPKAVRHALSASAFDFPARAVASTLRAHRVPASRAAAFIAALEDWARTQPQDTVRSGNRIEPATLPPFAELARRLLAV